MKEKLKGLEFRLECVYSNKKPLEFGPQRTYLNGLRGRSNKRKISYAKDQ